METTRKQLSDLHFEHQIWMAESKFYMDELKIYNQWLEEVGSKNTSTEIVTAMKHYQKQFYIQKYKLDKVIQAIAVHENWLSDYAEAHPVEIEQKYFEDHRHLREQMVDFKMIYNNLKEDYKNWLREVL
jgi:hypothetical protein